MNEILKLYLACVALGLEVEFLGHRVCDRPAARVELKKDGVYVDDAAWNYGTHGYEKGLLETYNYRDCEGWQTATETLKGWLEMLG